MCTRFSGGLTKRVHSCSQKLSRWLWNEEPGWSRVCTTWDRFLSTVPRQSRQGCSHHHDWSVGTSSIALTIYMLTLQSTQAWSKRISKGRKTNPNSNVLFEVRIFELRLTSQAMTKDSRRKCMCCTSSYSRWQLADSFNYLTIITVQTHRTTEETNNNVPCRIEITQMSHEGLSTTKLNMSQALAQALDYHNQNKHQFKQNIRFRAT